MSAGKDREIIIEYVLSPTSEEMQEFDNIQPLSENFDNLQYISESSLNVESGNFNEVQANRQKPSYANSYDDDENVYSRRNRLSYTAEEIDTEIRKYGDNKFLEDNALLNTLKSIDSDNYFLVYYCCLKRNVKLNHLQYLKSRHLKWLLPPETNLGALAMFEAKLEQWQLKKNVVSSNKQLTPTNKIDLYEIIKNDRILIAKYEKCQLTDNEVKRMLIHIVTYYTDRNMKLTNSDMEQIATQIEIAFPGETKHTYYHKNLAANPTGKLYNKWHNRGREPEEIPDEPENAGISEVFTTRNTECDFNESDMEKIRLWLCNYSEPLQEILEKWHATAQYRKNHLNKYTDPKDATNIFQQWPLYKSTHGHTLIGIDFKHIFPAVEDNLLSRWNLFTRKITEIYDKDLKDAKFVSDWNDYRQFDCNEDTKNACFLNLLPSIIKPSGRNQATITESQNSFLRYSTSAKDLTVENTEPFLICLGKNKFDVSKVLVFFDGVYFMCNTFLHGLEICFKIYCVFNIKYPKASNNLWVFIQNYFYGISFPNQKINPNVHRLIAKLNL